MAIGSVIDLIDYEKRTIEIAKKYGGSGTGDFKKTDMAPNWSSDLVYDRGDIVLYEGKFYFALIDNFVQESGMNPASMEYWLELGTIDEALGYMREDLKEYTDDKVASVNLSLIADNYNPNRTTSYPTNDMVVYDGKLYKSRSKVPPAIGEFDSDMWDLAANEYDSTQTYNEYDLATHEGSIYRCDVSNTTGEWDSSNWTDVSEQYNDYNSNARYPILTYTIKVKYNGNYYHNNANLNYTGTMGDFNSAYWVETTVEEVINNVKSVSVYIGDLNNLNTDAKGFITIPHPTSLKDRACIGIKVVSGPYGVITKNTYELMIGSADGGTNGPIKIRVYDENMDLVTNTLDGIGVNGSIQLVFI